MEDWRRYEQQIYNKLKSEFPGCDIEFDAKVKGLFSKVARQVDILVRGKLVGYDVFGAVECKHFNKHVDVGIVDGFIGFMEDIAANIGIIITNRGYSEGARNRAQVKGIHLDIVRYQEIDEYHFEWEACQMCGGPDRPPPPIDFEPPVEVIKDGISTVLQIGRCSYCDGIHVKCGLCGGITPVSEFEYNSPLECWGGCGVKFVLRSEQVEKELFEEWIEFAGYEQSSE